MLEPKKVAVICYVHREFVVFLRDHPEKLGYDYVCVTRPEDVIGNIFDDYTFANPAYEPTDAKKMVERIKLRLRYYV